MTTTTPQIALVTGGSRGIGLACARALLERGWQVHLCSRSSTSVAEAVERLGGDHPGRVGGRPVDVRREDEVRAWVEEVEATGPIDCLVNNAGLGVFGAVDALSGEDFRRMIDTNLTGAFYFLSAVARCMRPRGRGWIFNIASLAGRNPFAGGAGYNASKFGLVGMSEAAMLDLRQDGVRVVALLPGSVDTDFHAERRPEREWMLAPEDVARTVVDIMAYPARALPSLVELRPSRPPRRSS